MSDSAQDELRARLVQLFREELQDNLWLLATGVTELEGRPGRETEQRLIPELFRAAHSLKGAAHSAGVAAAIEPCRQLEELLALLRDGERALDDDALAVFTHAIDELAVLDRQMGVPSSGPLDDHAPADDGPPTIVPTAVEGTAGLRARVEVAELDDLVGRAGVLVAATARLHLLAQSLGAERDAAEPGGSTERLADEASAVDRDLGHAARQVVDAAQELRMQRVSDMTAGLEHTVRELARSMGKQAELSVKGGDLKVDRDVGDALREPLLHLVRNAVGHGLETADERVAQGKSPVGQVQIEASLQGGRVRIVVTDDGRGIDVGALRSVVHDRADSEADGVELAFQPGVSTASAVSDVSGRGVGLDAVRSRVESLGGTVHLQTAETGDSVEDDLDGTHAVIQVPTTLSVVRIVLVEVAGELIGLPAGTVKRAQRVESADLQFIDGHLLLISDGEARPVLSLGGALGLPTEDHDHTHRTIIELIDERSVLLVDRVDTEFEGVLKRLPARATAASSVLGAVILPTGRAALVVNPAACLRTATTGAAPASAAPTTSPTRPVVLLAEDTLTTRALERSILVAAGYEVIDVPDGAEAWRVLNEQPVDVVVSDVDMPRMGGIALCRSIRSSPRIGQIPVVLVTSMGSEDDRRRGVEAGANAYLVKSAFDQTTLLDAVRRLL